jgi:hypothetical protein
LLPSGPGGVGGITSRKTRHLMILALGLDRDGNRNGNAISSPFIHIGAFYSR